MNTRSASKKLAEQQAKSSAQEVPPTLPASEEQVSAKGLQRQCDKILLESVGKEEPRSLSAVDPTLSTTFEVSKANSKRSSSSSVLARKKRLELVAAEARAKIELDLINKRLEANLAEIDDERSIPSDHTNKGVEEWLEHSNQELLVQPVHDKGHTSDVPCPPTTQNVGTDGTVHLLASALKDLAAASTNNGLNSNLLSRICTPRELPFFSGDPMEWLHFKQAYEESSKVCNFNDNENLWRLRKCLKGSAREAVSALLISATSPETVISTLELQFGNPDIILSRIMVDIKKLHPVSQEYYKDIVPFSVKVRNCVAAVKVIGQDEYLNGIGITTCILSKLPPVLLSKWADYSYTFIKQGRKPTWFDISEFLNEEALKVSSMVLLNNKNVANYTQGTVLLNKTSDNNEKCKFCRISKHKLQDCKKFRKALRRDRWSFVKRNRICFKCMNSDHDRAICPAAACDVEDCGQPHHKLLHYKIPQALNSDNNTASEPSSPPPPVAPETVTHIKNSECKVLLKVVPVTVHGPNGILNTSALLDDGSTVTLISAELASRAGLRGRRETLRVQGAWDDSALVCDADVMSVCIANNNGERFNISARSFQNFSVPVQNIDLVNFKNYEHLSSIKDLFCYSYTKPEILIGQDNYNLLLPLDVRVGKCNEPCATRTPLGWCVHGLVPVSLSTRGCFSTLHVSEVQSGLAKTSFEDLHEMVRKSFTIESMGISGKPRQNADELRALEHLERTAKLIDGRWHVGLPCKDASCKMPDSERTALSRLHNLEKKMSLNGQYAQRYRDRVKHLLDNDFAKDLQLNYKHIGTNKNLILYSFWARQPKQKKLRLVFDARGLSRSDYLLPGPDLFESLLGICSIEKTRWYRRVKMLSSPHVAAGATHTDDAQMSAAFNDVADTLTDPVSDEPYNCLQLKRTQYSPQIITCRAIHLETVSSLSTDSLIMALSIASRCGWSAHLLSDNGINLRGTDAELKKSAMELDEQLLQTTAGIHGTRWTFIPPASPHWGGSWERLIRSVKVALKVVLKERAPKEEVLNTLLAEIETMVNGRPLSNVSVDVNSKESLTPNHFLLGSSSTSPQLGSFQDSDLYRRRQWRVAQRLSDMFWKRWVTEELPTMIPRQKWTEDGDKPLQVGDLVFIADPDAPRNVWPRGIIEEVFPGKDGRVRVVQVRTQLGSIKRSVARVAKFSLE